MNKASAAKVANVLFWHAVDILFYGVALKLLWEWFGQPTFHTTPVAWGTSFGLVIIVRLLFPPKEEEKAITLQNLVIEALVPALLTEAGHLLHKLL